MCTSVNNQPMSITWIWAGYGAFLFQHWHSQPFNGRLLDNSYLSVGLQFEFPTNPFHTDLLQSGSAGSQLPESGLFLQGVWQPHHCFQRLIGVHSVCTPEVEVSSSDLTSLHPATFSIQLCHLRKHSSGSGHSSVWPICIYSTTDTRGD